MEVLLNFLLFLLLFLLISRSCCENLKLLVIVGGDITSLNYNEILKHIKATIKFDFVHMQKKKDKR